jgi:hypothetical protein
VEIVPIISFARNPIYIFYIFSRFNIYFCRFSEHYLLNFFGSFQAGALPKLIGSVRNPDLDIAHVSCTAIGAIVKGFPQPDRLTASLSKKEKVAVVAAISQ